MIFLSTLGVISRSSHPSLRHSSVGRINMSVVAHKSTAQLFHCGSRPGGVSHPVHRQPRPGESIDQLIVETLQHECHPMRVSQKEIMASLFKKSLEFGDSADD